MRLSDFRGVLQRLEQMMAQIDKRPAFHTATGVKGVPQNFTPLVGPINPAAPTGSVSADFNNTNNVFVRLRDGSNQLVAYDNGLNALRNQIVNGPWITNMTASIYKSIPITERFKANLQSEFLNVFNHQTWGPVLNGVSAASVQSFTFGQTTGGPSG